MYERQVSTKIAFAKGQVYFRCGFMGGNPSARVGLKLASARSGAALPGLEFLP